MKTTNLLVCSQMLRRGIREARYTVFRSREAGKPEYAEIDGLR
jgi:hypothetical protein